MIDPTPAGLGRRTAALARISGASSQPFPDNPDPKEPEPHDAD